MKMNFVTEVINQYVRERSVSPDRESRIIRMDDISNIFSLGTDQALYLTKENESGEQAKFSRYKLIDKVISFAAEKINATTIAISTVVDNDVYIAYTNKAEKLKPDDFYKLDFKGVIGGIKLTPYRVLMTSFDKNISLFVEFHDPSGFSQQFMASLPDTTPIKVSYFRLASEFTDVIGSTAGRSARQFVDGIYTYGIFHAKNDSPYVGYVSSAPQLIYTPCRNPFGTTPPAPIRLKAECNVEAICTLIRPNTPQVGTHLFAVGDGKLYVYPFEEQLDWLQEPGRGVPTLLAESDHILNAKQIAAYILANRLYIFIRTAKGDLNYTVADYTDDIKSAHADHFLEPVNLMTDVMRFDVHDGKLSIFTKEAFIECTHDPVTGAFAMDSVSIETQLDTHHTFSAYSTRINIGESNAEVHFRSKNGEKIGFYCDGYYYKANKTILKSDNLGYVSIVQKTDGLSSDEFILKHGNNEIEVNPAQKMQQTLLSMTEESDFKNAVISDPFGNTTPLMPNTNQNSLSVAVSGMSSLHNSAIGLIPGIGNPVTKFANGVIMSITDKIISILPVSLTDNPFVKFVAHVINDITAAFKWIIGKIKALYDQTIGKAVNFIIQKTEKVWHFIAEVGGKVIKVVVDCVAKVVETVKNFLEVIGIPVGKILDFFKKALGLDRANQINSAIKNIATLSIDALVEKTVELKETSIDFLTEAIGTVEKWAGIENLNLEDQVYANPITTNYNAQLSNLGVSLDGHNMYAFDLVKGAITPDILTPEVKLTGAMNSSMQLLLKDMYEIVDEVEKIPQYCEYIILEIKTLINNFNLENLISTLKKILGVVAVEFLKVSRAILKTIFDIVIEGIKTVWMALNSPINIPFLSDVLKVFGIEAFSMVDIFTYPTAFLASAVSGIAKLLSGSELFDMGTIERMAHIKSLNELTQLGGVSYAYE